MLDLLITHANLPDGRTDVSVAVQDGRIVEVMGAAQSAGLNRIGFVADTPTAQP